MASANNHPEAKIPTTVTGEPTDQLAPEEDLNEPDTDEDFDNDDEPYEGIHHGEEDDDDMVDDNMTGMPVVPSPS